MARNPRAISAVVSPPTRRSVSAARESADREGWQDRKIESEDVVLDVVDLGVEVGHVRLLPTTGVLELRELVMKDVGAPEVIDGSSLGDGHQPPAGFSGTPARRPLLERGHERVLRQVLGESDITRHPREGADEAGRVGPPRGDDGLGRVIRTGLRRHDASVVSPLQAPGASGPVEIWRMVEITVTSGQYFACSSANSR